MILKFKNLRHYTSILKKSLIFFLKVKYNLRSKTNKHHPTLYDTGKNEIHKPPLDTRNSQTTTRHTKFTNHSRRQTKFTNHSRRQTKFTNHSRRQTKFTNHSRRHRKFTNHSRRQTKFTNHSRRTAQATQNMKHHHTKKTKLTTHHTTCTTKNKNSITRRFVDEFIQEKNLKNFYVCNFPKH